ncbi:N-acetylmuramate alpha-1-phosphate uridylyltransferase MurU [Thalassomonas sp. M1454]|uniref:N-acetylmuramate alpha-1-phosphate uridylyltransferase MurU n=1 Tax=Thalassomonas sp. M1454 TaxID=2594477 RepID=UPI001180E992|nr:nucleotidyltransferase family protein [Thalassomonas sp. M1454]TRX54030.1 nucleotidyltransferase family protein [Thalassomonas sp. M1454]
MKAMILAAGRGERMKPLTDTCPKPLLKVAGVPLIEHHLRNLKQAGITDIVINHAWLGEQIEQYFGDGKKFGVNIVYSAEGDGALETAGGIVKALPLLGDEPFVLVNGDIYCDFNFAQLPKLQSFELAHLILVKNPEHNLAGDFGFNGKTLTFDSKLAQANEKFTYSGLGVYHPKLFAGLAIEKAPLAPILIKAMEQGSISGTRYSGVWSDIGTPQRLEQINKQLTET